MIWIHHEIKDEEEALLGESILENKAEEYVGDTVIQSDRLRHFQNGFSLMGPSRLTKLLDLQLNISLRSFISVSAIKARVFQLSRSFYNPAAFSALGDGPFLLLLPCLFLLPCPNFLLENFPSCQAFLVPYPISTLISLLEDFRFLRQLHPRLFALRKDVHIRGTRCRLIQCSHLYEPYQWPIVIAPHGDVTLRATGDRRALAALGGDLVEKGLCAVVVDDAVGFDHSVDGESRAAFALAICAVAAVYNERLAKHPVTKILADAASFERVWKGVRCVSRLSRRGFWCCWARRHDGG